MLLPWELKPTFNFDFLYNHYRDFLSSIINEMLKFKNLPDTVSEHYLKHCLFDLGKVVFFRENSGEIRALNGNYSGSPDIYYLPEDIIVENPRLTKSYNLKRDKDCVIVYCTDSDVYTSWDNPPGCGGGLSSLIIKTATMLADNDLSLNIAQKTHV